MAGLLASGATSAVDSATAAKGQPSVYEGLRSMALGTSAQKLGLSLPDAITTAYGVVMDMGLSHGTATLVAFSTGDTSLYFSTGGGVIGAGRHETVKQSALAFLQVAQAHLALFSSTTKLSGPASGEVRFFVLTNRGILGAIAAEDEVNSGGLPISPLWYSGQQLLSDVRQTSDRSGQ